MSQINDKEKGADFELNTLLKPTPGCGCLWTPPKLTQWRRSSSPVWYEQLKNKPPFANYKILGTDDSAASPRLSNEALPYTWDEAIYQVNQMRIAINRLLDYYSPEEWGKPWSDNSEPENNQEAFFQTVNGTTDWLTIVSQPGDLAAEIQQAKDYFQEIEKAINQLGHYLAGVEVTAVINDNDGSKGDKYELSIDNESTNVEENNYTTLKVWLGPGKHNVKVYVTVAPGDQKGSFHLSVSGVCSKKYDIPTNMMWINLGSSRSYSIYVHHRGGQY